LLVGNMDQNSGSAQKFLPGLQLTFS